MSDRAKVYTINVETDDAWSPREKALLQAIALFGQRATIAERLAAELRITVTALAKKTLGDAAQDLPKSLHSDLERNATQEAIAHLRHFFPQASFSEEIQVGAESDPRRAG